MKNFCFIFILVCAFLLASCSGNKSSIAMGELDGVCFPNKTCNEGLTCDEESNLCVKIEDISLDDSDLIDTDSNSEPTDATSDTSDSADDSADSLSDDADTATDTTNPDNDLDTDQGRKQGELYGECYPNETCNKGLVCDIENNICIKDTENSEEPKDDLDDTEKPDENSDDINDHVDQDQNPQEPDNNNDYDNSEIIGNDSDIDSEDPVSDNDGDTDAADSGNDSGDSTADEDSDTADSGSANPCDSDPCSRITYSTGACTTTDGGYTCGCIEHYSWTGSLCEPVSKEENCSGKPENTIWNTVNKIQQTWDGEGWYPSNEAVYNTNPSDKECRFKCVSAEYTWNGFSCTKGISSATPCDPNPCLSVANSTQECSVFGGTNYKCECTSDYYWDGTVCGTVQTQTATCTGLPDYAEWNTVSEIIQKWDDYLGAWIPIANGSYNENPSTNQCRFKCKEHYFWNEPESKCMFDPANPLECSPQSETPCYDSTSHLTWSKKSNSRMSYSDAKTYCSSSEINGHGGYSDWRLPTISELRTLIQNCSNTQMPGGSCHVTYSCSPSDEWCYNDACSGCTSDSNNPAQYNKLGDTTGWLTGGFWSSSSTGNYSAWTVNFYNAEISSECSSSSFLYCLNDRDLSVRCVRSEQHSFTKQGG